MAKLTYTLDSLAIFFPWDDDFYTYMKNHGFGGGGNGSKTIPLIYSDNTQSTLGKKELKRKFVISQLHIIRIQLSAKPIQN